MSLCLRAGLHPFALLFLCLSRIFFQMQDTQYAPPTNNTLSFAQQECSAHLQLADMALRRQERQIGGDGLAWPHSNNIAVVVDRVPVVTVVVELRKIAAESWTLPSTLFCWQ